MKYRAEYGCGHMFYTNKQAIPSRTDRVIDIPILFACLSKRK